MSITTCPRCGTLYDESSNEEANNPDRYCHKCWLAAVNFGADDMDRQRDQGAKRNTEAFANRVGR